MTTDHPNEPPGPQPADADVPSADEEPAHSAEELRVALEKAAKAPTLLVASDFDGALAEFTVDPDALRPARRSHGRAARPGRLPDTHVAVASGRDVRTLRDLTGVGSAESITLIGSHGAEATRPQHRRARAGSTTSSACCSTPSPRRSPS